MKPCNLKRIQRDLEDDSYGNLGILAAGRKVMLMRKRDRIAIGTGDLHMVGGEIPYMNS